MPSTYPESKRPEIPARSDSYDVGEMIPGAYPEGSDIDIQLDETAPIACTSRTQTTDAPGTAEAIHNVEGVAAEIVHDVGHLLRNAEEAVKACYLSCPNTEESSTTHPKQQQSTHKLKDALHQVQSDTTTDSHVPSTLQKASPSVPLSESFGNMKISGKPTTLPSAIQDECYRSAMAYNMDDDPLDLGWIVYEDEVPLEDVSGVDVPERQGEKMSSEARDRASDRARGGYVPGDGSKPVVRGYGEGDVAVGHGGVTYNCSGHGNVLPGYPTQEGMGKLIFDRMMDDKLRLAEVNNPTSASMPAAISRSTNSSGGYPTTLPSHSAKDRLDMRGSGSDSGEERKVPCLDFRILEERRESPVFEDGSSSAPGKSEVTFKPDTSRSNNGGHHPLFPAVPTAIPRSTGVSPITTCSLPATSTRNNFPVQGGGSGLGSPQEERSVQSLKERRGSPNFRSGGPINEGQYKSTFEPDSSTNREGGRSEMTALFSGNKMDERKETPISNGSGQIAAGNFEAPLQPVSSSADPANWDSVHNDHKSKVGYLGKPISKSEEIKIEKAKK